MAYSEELANRVREELAQVEDLGEIKMYGGLCFMVNGKMCVCVGGRSGHGVMVRVGKDRYEELLQRKGAQPTIMKNRPVKGYISLEAEGQKELTLWVELALAFNRELTGK
jgi:hypothetical protein